MKPAAKLSSSLLKIGRGSRGGDSPAPKVGAPKVKAAPPEVPEATEPAALQAQVPEPPAPMPEPPAPEPPAPEPTPAPEALTPETVKPEAPAAAKPGLDLAAFDGAIPDLLMAEAEPPRDETQSEAPPEAEAPAQDAAPEAADKPAPAEPPATKPEPPEPMPEEPAPRLLDQFDWLRSKNAELARKESERRAARRPAPRPPLVEKPLEKPAKDARAPAATAEADPGTKAGLDDFLRNLRAGQFALAENHFARVMNLDPRLAKRILYNAELEDLAVICRALGLRSLEFATIVALLRGARPKGGFSASEGLKGSLGIFESVDREGALKLMEFIPELPQRDWSELKRL